MKLEDLPTPCLVLDCLVLQRNLQTMAQAAARHGVGLRPHMKTAKSIDVARMALEGQPGGITVSTLAEAEYFVGHGLLDILYAVGITPQKLAEVAKLNAAGANIAVITDDVTMATAIADCPVRVRALIEVDTGEGRGGIHPADPVLFELAAALGDRLAGVMTHAGHSYATRSPAELAAVAEAERAGITDAADRLRQAGYAVGIVSLGSTPTVLHSTGLAGVTEVRAGVYMFGDLFQMEIGSNALNGIALTVLASVIGRRPAQHRMLVDAGGMALSKDHSTAAAPMDYGFGLILDMDGHPTHGGAVVRTAYQEHGVVDCDPSLPYPDLPIGGKVRIAPNHACMTAAAHDRYYVVEGGQDVVAVWTRVNGW
jgi:D-serine deaminase-like pyridoxal phosphate-dependent protein